MACIEETGICLGSVRVAEGIGERSFILVSLSSLTAFLPDSCFVVNEDTSP